MRVAVCDDQQEALEDLCAKIEKTGLVKEVAPFQKIDDLKALLHEKEKPDVVFMDIEWNGDKNGIDFAEAIYKVSPKTKIIYVTSYTDKYVQNIFLKDANRSGFLVKPVQEEMLRNIIERLRRLQYRESREKLLIPYKSRVFCIPIRNILYVESRSRYVTIHTVKSSYTCIERMKNMKDRLDSRFVYCHKSFLVNMNAIELFLPGEMVLKTGKQIPISKGRYRETKQTFFQYMGHSF